MSTDHSDLFYDALCDIRDKMTNCEMLWNWFIRRRDDADNAAEREEFDRRAQIIKSELGEIGSRLERLQAALKLPGSTAAN